MAFQVKNNVYWVGKIDWELRRFHGSEYSTHRGSTYNSYLVKEEKTVLIDTVWDPYASEFVSNLDAFTDLSKIDAVIANHGEVDHAGALTELLRRIPDVPVYCTANGVKSLKGQYHGEWNLQVVKTGDELDIGNGKKLVFVEMPMLHWPDSMATYLTGDNILFSNDAFGQHYASESMYNDQVDRSELEYECIKYYANILTPFSKMVEKKIKEVLSLGLPIDLICTSHGVIWRDNPTQIVEKYLTWADAYQENRITLLYDTMWEGTRQMADYIARGIQQADGGVTVKSYNVSKTDRNDMITDVFRSKAILLGSPTINRGIMSDVAGVIEAMKGLGFRGKKAAAFGCYGWSGEGVKILGDRLSGAGFEIVDDGLRLLWEPGRDALDSCEEYGRSFAAKI